MIKINHHVDLVLRCATAYANGTSGCKEIMESVRAVRAHLSPPSKCSHKFVDSKSCLKCGWTPPEEAMSQACREAMG